MESFAYVLLAVIGNLDEVVYEYQVEGTPQTKTVRAEDASAFFGREIKDCGGSVRLLDALIKSAGLDRYAFAAEEGLVLPEQGISFDLVDLAADELASVSVTVYRDGEVCATQAAQNADNSPLASGERLFFTLLAEDMGGAWDAQAELVLEFSVQTTEGARYTLPGQLRLAARPGVIRQLTLSGSAAEGYRLSQ